MFSVLKPFLFNLDPEAAHDLAIKSLKLNLLPKKLFEVKDEDLLKKIEKNTHFSKKDRGGMVKIDLHIEKINSYYHRMKNSEIIQIQMEYCKKELDQAMMKHKKSIEIVHGIGGGVLKSEVHKLLDLYNLNFFVSNNGGSTEVIL